MKCSNCGQPATQLAERDAPGLPALKRFICGDKKCQPPASAGWTMYPASTGVR